MLRSLTGVGCRFCSTTTATATSSKNGGKVTAVQSIVYTDYGDPEKVLQLSESTLPAPANGQVLIQTMATPINPADINQIQGVYPVKPTLPAIAGNEGVAKVVQVGPDVTGLAVGNWVIPHQAGQGTWTTHRLCAAHKVLKLPRDIPMQAAATLLVNPPTAYRMLKDFVQMERDDVFIQNGANSGVGLAAIQIGQIFGLKSINIVRDRPDLEKLKTKMTELGANFVLTEEELRGKLGKSIMANIGKPRLAFNCVGGKSSLFIASCLRQNGKMVTYGGMSKAPVQIPTGPFIFKNISSHGFWMSRWYAERKESCEERDQMVEDLCMMVEFGQLKPPDMEEIKFANFANAIENAMEGKGRKQLLTYPP